MIGIYKITNIVNGKFYIGQTVNLSRRWSKHKYHLKRKTHHSVHLQNAWHEYGKDAFKFEILEEVNDANKLDELEQKYLDELKPWDREIGYNNAKFVEGPTKGRKLSEEHKRKIGDKSRGHITSEETKLKIGSAQLGKKNHRWGISPTEEAKQQQRDALLGTHQSEEHLRKRVESFRKTILKRKISKEKII